MSFEGTKRILMEKIRLEHNGVPVELIEFEKNDYDERTVFEDSTL